jgi:hypothetical protein
VGLRAATRSSGNDSINPLQSDQAGIDGSLLNEPSKTKRIAERLDQVAAGSALTLDERRINLSKKG